MIYKPDKKLIREIMKKIGNRSIGIRLVYVVEKALLTYLLLMIFVYPIVCFLSGYDVRVNNSDGGNSYIIVTAKVIVAVCLLQIPFYLSLIRRKYSFTVMGGRSYEEVKFKNGKMYYSYKNSLLLEQESKMVVVTDLKKINQIKYDEEIGLIKIEGKMQYFKTDSSDESYDSIKEELTDNILEITDYFSPSVYKAIKEQVQLAF